LSSRDSTAPKLWAVGQQIQFSASVGPCPWQFCYRAAMIRALLVGTLLVSVGCGDDGAVAVDAGPPDAPWSCPPQMAPLSAGTYTFYLNFEGVTLTKASEVHNSTTNTTDLLAVPTATVPPFREGSGTRQLFIDAITGMVTRALAPYSLNVVTTRPASGDYYMSVLGGTSQALVGQPNTASVAPAVCQPTNRNLISLVFDLGDLPADQYAFSLLSDFGAMTGLAPTTTAGDCLCRMSGCEPTQTTLCTYGVDVPVVGSACGRATQNEPMLLAASLGCR
jgi:hypothetical protein